MAQGIVFDIKQMAVFDGPGIRTTVFLKGCPLRCRWCHNPEGLSFSPQLMVSGNGCTHCGSCRRICPSPDHCTHCGTCVRACPMRLRKIAGTPYEAKDLAKKLLRDKEIFAMNGGGITLSGGEPTSQPEFVLELLSLTKDLHRAMETCGYCPPETFRNILDQLDYLLMDIKLADPILHKQWTGKDNHWILENLEQVKTWGKPFVIRIPLIPGVTDTPENLTATAKLLEGAAHLVRVELLPYHTTAGAKYEMTGQVYQPDFDPAKPVNTDCTAFTSRDIPAVIL